MIQIRARPNVIARNVIGVSPMQAPKVPVEPRRELTENELAYYQIKIDISLRRFSEPNRK